MGKGSAALVLRSNIQVLRTMASRQHASEGCSSTPEQFITATETLGFSIAEFSDSLTKPETKESCNVLLYLEM